MKINSQLRVRRRVAALATAVVTAVGLGMPAVQAQSSGSSGSSGSAPVVSNGDVDPFYEIDDVTPAAPGEILKDEQAPYSGLLGNADLAIPDTVTKIMYTTTDSENALRPVTGYVVEPIVPWRGDGPRPTLVVGRGTVGQGDQCAPSRNWPLDNQPDPTVSGRFVNLEAIYDMIFANQGVRVVVTDLIGMGTPGMHSYMNRVDQGHAMIDAARAAHALSDDPEAENAPVAFYGHSQGGGAATAAVELEEGYAPDLNVVGAYASAPPADLYQVAAGIDGSDLVGAIGFTINGLVDKYPEIEAIIDDNINEGGRKALDDLSEMCTNEIMADYGNGTTTRDWIQGNRSLVELIDEHPAARRAVADQRIGNGTPQAPVMIISGRFDRNVAYGQAKDLARKWCMNGAQVVYRDDTLPELGTIGEHNHVAQAASGAVFGMPFILDRFHGRELNPDTTCINFNGNEGGSSAVEMGSSLSSLPLSSALVPEGSSEGPSSGREGSSILAP